MAIDNFATTAAAGIGSANVGRAQQSNRTPLNLEEVATKLGVDVEELINALGSSPGKLPDFANAAFILDISEESLRDALPQPPPQWTVGNQNTFNRFVHQEYFSIEIDGMKV